MEGETLPRFDSKSRMCANVKYPREHRIPGYAQRAVFFHLEIVTGCASLQYYTVLVYVSVLVGSVHLRLFPLFPHVFRCQAHLLDTIYCGCMPCCTYIQCASLYLLALLFTSSGPIASSRSPSVLLAALACPRPCVRLLMPGQRWTFLSAVPVWPALLARVCARSARLLACARARCARPLCVACLLPLFAPIL